MYQNKKDELLTIFKMSSFSRQFLKELDKYASALKGKFGHIYTVANLMESAATIERLDDDKKLMAYCAGLYHDIACLPDIALTGREYGPILLILHSKDSTENLACFLGTATRRAVLNDLPQSLLRCSSRENSILQVMLVLSGPRDVLVESQ